MNKQKQSKFCSFPTPSGYIHVLRILISAPAVCIIALTLASTVQTLALALRVDALVLVLVLAFRFCP